MSLQEDIIAQLGVKPVIDPQEEIRRSIDFLKDVYKRQLQVSYFKWTKKRTGEGRRIFRMTPFHHHLELGGLSGNGPKWSEWKVDAFLWSVGAGMSALTLLIYYLINS